MKRKRRKTTTSLLPKGKRERRRIEILGGTAVLSITAVIVFAFCTASTERFLMGLPQTAAVISSILVELANSDRSANNVSQLTVNPVLVAVAQAKANDMATKSYFAHVAPDGKDPWYWFQQAGYKFTYAGENLAIDFSDSSDVEQAWMHSPTHRENILDPHYTEIGIATAEGAYEGHPTIFVVQEFGTPAPAAAQAPAPTPIAQTIATSSVPTNPQTIAIAEAPKPKPKSVAVASVESTSAVATSSEVLGAGVAPTEATPITMSVQPISSPVAYVEASPRSSLRYFYYMIGIFLLLALIYATRFEMKKRHLRHVGVVTSMAFLMGFLFITANYFIFTLPVIPSQSASAYVAASR